MTKKTICVITGTRAEYGLLRPLIKRIQDDPDLELRLIATGKHLSAEFGFTYREIEADSFPIHAKIEMLLSSDTHGAMAKSTGLGMISFADYFTANRPDMVVVLGDRFELMAAATAAAMMNIPIAHINGGDISLGAIDEFIRHSITQMACLHFPTNARSAEKIIQMTGCEDGVFNVGSMGVENILTMDLLSLEELGESLDFKLDRPYGLVTYHPVTRENDDSGQQIQELLKALAHFPNMKFIITKANSDSNGRIINSELDKIRHENMRVFTSLGVKRYLSAMKYAAVVIGNSSSGLYETPAFGVPCVNIGDRQKGRFRGENVVDCEPQAKAIENAIGKALSSEFKMLARDVVNPFGDGGTSQMILMQVRKVLNLHIT